jgi:hypothetical protein
MAPLSNQWLAILGDVIGSRDLTDHDAPQAGRAPSPPPFSAWAGSSIFLFC